MKRAGYILLVCFSLISLQSCWKDKFYAFSGYAQGGTWTVKVNLRGSDLSTIQMMDSIKSILNTVDTTFSGYNKNSIVSRRNAGQDVQTNAIYDDLLSISEDFNARTEGAFDVYSAPLYDIWGFGFTNSQLPKKALIDTALVHCRRHEKVNFNAIAQGYTCDLVAAFLLRHKAKDYLVDIGEIACAGHNPSGESWSVSIDTPEDGNETPGESSSGIWHSNDRKCGIVTSGNYRKFYVIDGVKYSHTIDPRTGYPVDHDLLSATVVAPTATEADALATYFMVIGYEAAREKVLEMDTIEACLISSRETWTSPGF